MEFQKIPNFCSFWPTHNPSKLYEKKHNEQQREQQQVRHNPQTNDPSPDFRSPVHHFDDINSFQSNSANHNVRENSASSDNVKGSKSKVLEESALWNKLESWVPPPPQLHHLPTTSISHSLPLPLLLPSPPQEIFGSLGLKTKK
ncbi:unnamed protein product [Ilex paraguariensis]|uniref:Uncharacterized protein n=1 Tax=Ilex paraguariensis TaxID=185542 RepID=A0ABC8RBP8_9AQUA